MPVGKPEKKEYRSLITGIPAQRGHLTPQRVHSKSWQRFTVDLRLAKHRRVVFIFLVGFVIIGVSVLVSSYKIYEYTESSEFCGTVCHTMDPQFTRYQHSEHTNVECVACHVGSGPDYYIKSKIEGARQLFTMLTNTYSRPIKSPVHNLRPARETCETCHNTKSFKDNVVKKTVHYANDESSSIVMSTFILKMGGWQQSTGMSQGIHWHISNPVYYIAADDQRQVILWVGVKQEDGSLKEFFSRDLLLMANTSMVEEARARGEVREMDCIDCHNRAAHDIPPPEQMVDEAIHSGLISHDLPFIRAQSIELLKAGYETYASALTALDGLTDYYRTNYPQEYIDKLPEINSAVAYLKEIYSNTNFPDMNLDWRTNPNNEKHSYSLGCFRCHDDKHVTLDPSGNEGQVISVSCNLCHTVPIVGSSGDLLVEAPVIVGSAPATHASFRWTIEHQGISEAEKQDCYQCHGQGFCNNGVCHNLSHPPDMLFTHADEYRKQGNQVCYTCHQDILCSRCHAGGIVKNP